MPVIDVLNRAFAAADNPATSHCCHLLRHDRTTGRG
jgi:hypothetical protein